MPAWLSVSSGLYLEAGGPGWGKGERLGQVPAASLSKWLLRFSSRWWQNLTSFPFPFLGFLSAVLAKGILKEGKWILVFFITYSICKNNIKIMSMEEG